jgi:hypothetical protein
MDDILLYLKFKDRLPMPLMRNRATPYKEMEFKTDEFSKKFRIPLTKHSNPACGSRVSKITVAYAKEQSHGDGVKYVFY